jgi:aminoglycoside phosphotransferase (APT) family kinase protein
MHTGQLIGVDRPCFGKRFVLRRSPAHTDRRNQEHQRDRWGERLGSHLSQRAIAARAFKDRCGGLLLFALPIGAL